MCLIAACISSCFSVGVTCAFVFLFFWILQGVWLLVASLNFEVNTSSVQLTVGC